MKLGILYPFPGTDLLFCLMHKIKAVTRLSLQVSTPSMLEIFVHMNDSDN